MSRVRSPNYPSISLPNAIEKIRLLHKLEGQNSVSREAIVKAMGYGSLNGASATILSAVAKYGLIEQAGDGEARITDLAMKIMFPDGDDERMEAIKEAAFRPALFTEMRDKWPDRPPSDDAIKSYLARKGFTQSALEQVIQFYRETLDIVARRDPAHDLAVNKQTKEAAMLPAQQAPESPYVPPPPTPASGRPFNITFDGMILSGTLALKSVRDIERLMRVLEAQKGAMAAMQEDETDDEDSTESAPS